MSELAVTVVGRDRPGIIADVSGILAGLGLNLTDTTMTLLRGHFTMTLVCAGEATVERVGDDLEPLTLDGSLTVSVRVVRAPAAVSTAGVGPPAPVPGGAAGEPVPGGAAGDPVTAALGTMPDTEPYVLTVYGADRMGIVSALTRLIADAGGNITDLNTRLSGELYMLVAEVDLDARTDLATLRDHLNEAASALGVEASLRPVDADRL